MIYGSCVCCIHIQMLCTHILASTDAQEGKHICTCALAHTVCTHSKRMTNSRQAVHVRRQDGHRRGFSVYAKHVCDTSMLNTAHETHTIRVCRSHVRINTLANTPSRFGKLCISSSCITGANEHTSGIKHTYVHADMCMYTYTGSQVKRLVVSVLFLCCGLRACLQGWSMIFYCFPRIIGRVHREGKAIYQSMAERNRETRGDREKGREGWR